VFKWEVASELTLHHRRKDSLRATGCAAEEGPAGTGFGSGPRSHFCGQKVPLNSGSTESPPGNEFC